MQSRYYYVYNVRSLLSADILAIPHWKAGTTSYGGEMNTQDINTSTIMKISGKKPNQGTNHTKVKITDDVRIL
jgi:hypothetical protein